MTRQKTSPERAGGCSGSPIPPGYTPVPQLVEEDAYNVSGPGSIPGGGTKDC